jgi:hypothetical protein
MNPLCGFLNLAFAQASLSQAKFEQAAVIPTLSGRPVVREVASIIFLNYRAAQVRVSPAKKENSKIIPQ